MIKLIIFAVLAFIVYRFYISPIKKSLDERKAKIIDDEGRRNSGNNRREDGGDYVDYEEIK
jgi:hypothetical protein